MGFSDVSLFMKMAMFLGICAFLLDLIGFASPYWLLSSYRGHKTHFLLWQYCTSAPSRCDSIPDKTSAIYAGQAFNVLGFLAGAASVVLIILYIFFKTYDRRVAFVGMLANFVAACCIIVGVIIIGTSDDIKSGWAEISWAMIFAIVSAFLFIVTGVLMAVARN